MIMAVILAFHEPMCPITQPLAVVDTEKVPTYVSILWVVFHTTPEHRVSYFAEILLPAVFKIEPLSRNAENYHVLLCRCIF